MKDLRIGLAGAGAELKGEVPGLNLTGAWVEVAQANGILPGVLSTLNLKTFPMDSLGRNEIRGLPALSENLCEKTSTPAQFIVNPLPPEDAWLSSSEAVSIVRVK